MPHESSGTAKVLPGQRWITLIVIYEMRVQSLRPMNAFDDFRCCNTRTIYKTCSTNIYDYSTSAVYSPQA